MAYLCVALSVVNCVRMVPVTAPRQAENILLEILLGCASAPCLHVETHVVRTAASLRMTAVSEFCHCVHATCSTRCVFSFLECWSSESHMDRPRTFLGIVRHCVALSVVNCFSHGHDHCAVTCYEHLAGKTVWLCVGCLHVEPYECADDSCRRILSLRASKMF